MSTTTTTQQTTPQPTATETALMNNELQVSNAGLPGTIQNQGYAQNLQGLLMTGQSLPGYLNSLPGGVSSQQSQNEAQLGNQGIATQFQSMGGLDSGSAAQAMAGNYANTLNTNAQFNVQNLAQLMNLASGNAYQNVGNSSANNSMLGSQSGALASTNTTSTSNPFLNSFYSSLGNMASGQTETQALGQAIGCWVASEIFGGWYEFDTIMARFYVNFLAPQWFKKFYLKYGESIAKYISNKPILKKMLKPLFLYFGSKSKEKLYGNA